MIEIFLAAVILGLVASIIIRDHSHQRQMQNLASDFSDRLQEYHRKVVVLCTEPDSEEAQEIIMRTRLTKVTDDLTEINKTE